jgi:long-chain acyl-CoA synthetase
LFMMQAPLCKTTDFSSLELIVYGASPAPIDLVRNARRAFGCDLAQVYGLTETTGAITYLPPQDHEGKNAERLKSCGKAMSGVEIRVVDADGNEVAVGEVGEIITRSSQNMLGGENIYPAEVESALFGHPAVADVAVIGIPDASWGEAVKAIVVKKSGANITAEELIGFARERIAHYKAPRSIDFVETLPRTPTGKILKRELRKPFWAGQERQVH